MKTALLFDSEGRCIGRESRSTDQWGAGPMAPNMKFIADNEVWKYKNLNEWWFSEGEIKRRELIEMPKPLRQRLRGQPAIHWLKVESEGSREQWRPSTIYQAGDVIAEGFITRASGISGSVRPDFESAAAGHWDYSEPVIWRRRAGKTSGAEAREPLAAYLAGELIAVDGVVWVAIRPGVTGQSTPDFVGDEVEDSDSIVAPIPDIGAPVYVRVGSDLVLATEPIKLTGREPTRISIALDSPGHYSEPYIVAVEGPSNAG